jgi:hypothetical protein
MNLVCKMFTLLLSALFQLSALSFAAAEIIVSSTQVRNYPGCTDISTGLGDSVNIYVCPDSVRPLVIPPDHIEGDGAVTGFSV